MNELVSYQAFRWILTGLTGGLAGTWLVYDAINLIRIRNADRTDPTVRDKRFGYVIGIVVALVGVVGCLKFHHVI